MIKNLKSRALTKQAKLIHLSCFFIYSLCIEAAAKDFQPIGTVNPSKYIPAQQQISESKMAWLQLNISLLQELERKY